MRIETANSGWGDSRGGLPFERGGDARRLAKACKFRILVSLEQNATEFSRKGLVYSCTRIFLIRFIYSFRGQKKLGPLPYWSPLGV